MARVLDLFCGAGGFTLGFERAGHDVIAGVDSDENAIETYETNFVDPSYESTRGESPNETHNLPHRAIQQNLTAMSPVKFASEYDIHPEDVEVVIGGPPCQGFSTANHERDVDDERNNLVFVFADYVAHYQPEVFLMENVRGIRTIDDGELLDRLVADFETAGYTVEHELLNAADYGVPQTRKRVFVQGRLDDDLRWPEPTHAPREELEGKTQGKLSAFGDVSADD